MYGAGVPAAGFWSVFQTGVRRDWDFALPDGPTAQAQVPTFWALRNQVQKPPMSRHRPTFCWVRRRRIAQGWRRLSLEVLLCSYLKTNFFI